MNTRKLFMQSRIQFSPCALYFYLLIGFASYGQPNEMSHGHDESTGTDSYAISSACNLLSYPPIAKGLSLGKQSRTSEQSTIWCNRVAPNPLSNGYRDSYEGFGFGK